MEIGQTYNFVGGIAFSAAGINSLHGLYKSWDVVFLPSKIVTFLFIIFFFLLSYNFFKTYFSMRKFKIGEKEVEKIFTSIEK